MYWVVSRRFEAEFAAIVLKLPEGRGHRSGSASPFAFKIIAESEHHRVGYLPALHNDANKTSVAAYLAPELLSAKERIPMKSAPFSASE